MRCGDGGLADVFIGHYGKVHVRGPVRDRRGVGDAAPYTRIRYPVSYTSILRKHAFAAGSASYRAMRGEMRRTA